MATDAGAVPAPPAGVRVLDPAHAPAAPFACHRPAHPGTEVVKAEAAGRGDPARDLGAAAAGQSMDL